MQKRKRVDMIANDRNRVIEASSYLGALLNIIREQQDEIDRLGGDESVEAFVRKLEKHLLKIPGIGPKLRMTIITEIEWLRTGEWPPGDWRNKKALESDDASA